MDDAGVVIYVAVAGGIRWSGRGRRSRESAPDEPEGGEASVGGGAFILD